MSTQLFDLTGKIALVSGASRGIGEETARLLAEQGAHVIVSSRKIEDWIDGEETVQRLKVDVGGNQTVTSLRTSGGVPCLPVRTQRM